MNPKAFMIIEKIGLKHPESYSIQEAIDSQRNKFYLRYNKSKEEQSRVIGKDEIIALKNELEFDMQEGTLAKLEDAFDSIAGCVSYVNQDGIYGEYVDGHIQALLRKGICKKRFFIDNSGKVRKKDTFQGFEAIQMKGGYIWKPCTVQNSDGKMDRVIEYLKQKQDMIAGEKDLLLEILITEEEIIACDAKYPGLTAIWQGIKCFFDSEVSECYLKKNTASPLSKKQMKIDGFDIDASPVIPNIVVANGALLSHYITRNFKAFESIKLL